MSLVDVNAFPGKWHCVCVCVYKWVYVYKAVAAYARESQCVASAFACRILNIILILRLRFDTEEYLNVESLSETVLSV